MHEWNINRTLFKKVPQLISSFLLECYYNNNGAANKYHLINYSLAWRRFIFIRFYIFCFYTLYIFVFFLHETLKSLVSAPSSQIAILFCENKNFFPINRELIDRTVHSRKPVLFIPRLVDAIEIFLSCRPLSFASFDSECPATGCNRPFKILRLFRKLSRYS